MADFTINQFGDSRNSGSLRHAIIQANNSAEDDVINLSEGTYTLSLMGQDENESQTGDLDIANNGTLTIQGLGNGAIIDAQEIDRVFDIAENATVILKNVTLTNGNALSDSYNDSSPIDQLPVGGGILVRENSNVTLRDSTISYNKTTQIDSPDLSGGGGIFVDSGANLTIVSSNIINNEVTRLNEEDQGGGGIYVAGNATVSITDSLISHNQARWFGGGILNRGHTTLNNTTVSDNHSDHIGGGITNRRFYERYPSVILELNDSLITNNTAGNHGAGIHNLGGEAILDNTKVTYNIAEGNGGGIYYEDGYDIDGKLLIRNQSEINYNTADKDYGGGISSFGMMEISDSLIKGNKVVGRYEEGGGIYNYGSATFNRVTIAENTAYYGAGIAQAISGDLTLSDSWVEENIAEQAGGGLYLGGETTINNSTIIKNRTTNASGEGGGIHVDEYSKGATITDTVIDNNQSVEGGGIYNEDDLTVINNTQIINNQAQYGGGIYHHVRTITVIDSNINNNEASNGDGGGFYHNRGFANIINSSITNNIATSDDSENGSGGGIYHDTHYVAYSNVIDLIGSTIADNQADNHGGGIFAPYEGVTKLTNSTIINNIADADNDDHGEGGGILNRDYYNFVEGEHTAIVNLKNSVIAYNQKGLGGDSVDSDAYNSEERGFFIANNNNLIGNTNGGNGFGENDLLNIDPLLGPLQDNGNGRLTAAPLTGSPLIDAGNNANLPADTYDIDEDGNLDESLPFDGRGDPRIKGESVDIGAVEGTGNENPVDGGLDIDGNGILEQQDYNLIGLYASQLDESEFDFLINNFSNDLIGKNATRTDAQSILNYWDEMTNNLLDIDGNEQVELQDYNLIDLYASQLDVVELGFLIENYPNDLMGENATRTDANSVLAYFETIVPEI